MCEVSKMPATSLFTPSMEHLAEIVPAIQGELSKAEQFVQSLAEGDSASRIGEWLEDDNVECFFEVGMDKCPALKVSLVTTISSSVTAKSFGLLTLHRSRGC